MMRIAVAGTGYVGLVAGVCFAYMGHDVTCVDIDVKKVEMLRNGIPPIFEADLEEYMKKCSELGRIHYTTDYRSAYKNADVIFIGVGTPEMPDGSANLSYVRETARQIAESVVHDCLVVVKSTVPVGTNDMVEKFIKEYNKSGAEIEVASNPEFLSQGSAVHDTLHAPRIVIGTESEKAERILRDIYAPFNLPIVSVSRRSAEMIKYACNDFLALKISYMNDIANLCELVGADITDVAKGMSYDKRIGADYLNAGIGYGGSCFPKDTKALRFLAKQHGYTLRTVDSAVGVNTDQKTVLFKKASKRFDSFKGVKTAVLGLTFKPNTDDLREAPSLDNISLLLDSGADITAFDPVGTANFKKSIPEGSVSNGSIRFADSAQEALDGAQVCFIFTEWKEIRSIEPERFARLMKTPIVYDGRNIYDIKKMKNAGVEYYSIGR
ncbi:MAG: UDP-glucose/GDP-mannose dehydrogenase family protein [Clostridia bacterium]|nr:UDP-glucose/GDP-mannose dehydrogenase family protein [Clostridia bacterium]